MIQGLIILPPQGGYHGNAIQAALEVGENRTDFVELAVERELARRGK